MACAATVVACSSCHRSSARCPLIKWRLRNIDVTMLRICECFGPMVGAQVPTCKHALCMPSSHAAVMCSCRHAFGPLCFARAPNPDAVEAKALHTRQLGDDLSSGPLLLSLGLLWPLQACYTCSPHTANMPPPYSSARCEWSCSQRHTDS